MNTAPRTRRTTRWTRRVLAMLAATAATTVVTAAPALAETDSMNDQCISVSGATRACLYGSFVNWGSGISWNTGGQLVDRNGGDYWTSTMEISLDRKWSSDTPFMQVLRVGNWQTHTSGTSGYDPTYGAWVRLCSTSQGGTKYCLAPRYVNDNS